MKRILHPQRTNSNDDDDASFSMSINEKAEPPLLSLQAKSTIPDLLAPISEVGNSTHKKLSINNSNDKQPTTTSGSITAANSNVFSSSSNTALRQSVTDALYDSEKLIHPFRQSLAQSLLSSQV